MESLEKVLALIAVILASSIGNVLALVFILKNKSGVSRKDKIVALLCSLNLFQVVAFVLELVSAFRTRMEDITCICAAFIVCFSTYSSIGCFIFLVYDRYLCIVYPFKYIAMITKKYATVLYMVTPLIIGVVLASAPLLGWSKYGRARPNSTYCGYDFNTWTDNSKSYFYCIMILCFILPITLTVVCFVRILQELQKAALSVTRRFRRCSTISKESRKSVRETFISSFLIGTIYIISWVPYAIVCCLFYHQVDVSINVELFAIIMSKSSTVTSPVIFCLAERRVIAFYSRGGSTSL